MDGWMDRCGGDATCHATPGHGATPPAYLAFALCPLPGAPAPLAGLLQRLRVRLLLHHHPRLLNVSCSVRHGSRTELPLKLSVKKSLRPWGEVKAPPSPCHSRGFPGTMFPHGGSRAG